MRRVLVAAFIIAFGLPSVADAQSVIVLGIRSVEGDDDFARSLTGAIRSSASRVSGWDVSDADVSLEQMTLVHGCDEPDAACMASIAGDLSVQRIVYGTVRRTGVGEQYNYSLSLYFFNADNGQIEHSETDTIPRMHSDIDDLRDKSSRYMTLFSGGASFGSVRVAVEVPGASVSIDDEIRGITDDAGVLIVEDVTEGEHDIRIEADGYGDFEGSVRVVADEQSMFRATLSHGGSSDFGWIPGVAGIGLGVVFAIPWITNFSQVRSHNSRVDELANGAEAVNGYEQLYTAGNIEQGMDVCNVDFAVAFAGEADAARLIREAEEGCSDFDSVSAKMWAFGALSLTVGIIGVAWLIYWAKSRDTGNESAGRLMLTPYADQTGGGMAAHLTF